MVFENRKQENSFMKREAERLGITPMAAYTTYYAMLLLKRLTLINKGELVVKGSFSQYVHLNELSRPVLDIDLSSLGDGRVPLELLYRTIYYMNDDNVEFDLSTVPRQTKNGVYKIPVIARVKYEGDKDLVIPVPIDYKENNRVIFETQFKAVEPLFTGDTKYYINTPSFEEHLAEKLYIIAHNTRTDMPNTRVKDFYDVYKLFGKDYDADKFSLYFQAMIMMYGMNLESISSDFLNKEFINRHLELWEQIKVKYQFTDKDVDLRDVVYYTKAVLNEQIQRIRRGNLTEDAKCLARIKGGR